MKMRKRYKLHTEHITLILPGLSHYINMDLYVGFYLTMYVILYFFIFGVFILNIYLFYFMGFLLKNSFPLTTVHSLYNE